MIELQHVAMSYNRNSCPLKDINATINKGDVISLIGPSGSGKSTLLRCIMMLEHPTSGKIFFNGEEITAKGCDLNAVRLRMGMVFQNFNLFPHLTAIENIMIPQMDLLKRSKTDAYNKAMELLRDIGLVDKAFSYPRELSGGQQQRIAIARTVAVDPEVILFDEPTSALDPNMTGEVEAVIRDLSHNGHTMLIVTHEMAFAREISNKVFYMDQGIIYETGSPDDIFKNPQKELTRRFIHRLKVLEILITSRGFDFLEVTERIKHYCLKNNMDIKSVNRVQSTFEELIKELLLPEMPEKPLLFAVFEYDSLQNFIYMTVRYNGKNFNPLDSDDLISLAILKHNSHSLTHFILNDDPQGYTNQIDLQIK